MTSGGEADWVRSQVLAAFGLKEWQSGAAPVPWYARIWRAVTFAYRRGKAVDWRSYNAAEAEYRAREQAYVAALPVRAQEIADQFSGMLPEDMRFEWGVSADD